MHVYTCHKQRHQTTVEPHNRSTHWECVLIQSVLYQRFHYKCTAPLMYAYISADVPIHCVEPPSTWLLRSSRAEVMARRWTGGHWASSSMRCWLGELIMTGAAHNRYCTPQRVFGWGLSRYQPVLTAYSGTSDKGHLCIKDTFRYINLYSGNTYLPLKEDNLSIMDKMIRPNVSVNRRFRWTVYKTAIWRVS